MSLLNDSLCINRCKKDYCARTHAGGAGVSARPPPERTKHFFRYMGGFFATFSPYGGLHATLFFL